MRFLADENFALKSINLLCTAGHDVKAVFEIARGAKDRQVLSLATSERRIILTFDRDYGALIYHRRLPTPAGVVYFRFAPMTPEEPAEHLLNLLSTTDLLLDGRFTVIGRRRVRQRPLP